MNCSYCGSSDTHWVYLPEIEVTVTHEERIAPPPGVPDRGVTRTASGVERRYQEKFLICDDCGAIWSHRNVSTYEGMDRAVWDSAVEPQQLEAAIAGCSIMCESVASPGRI